MSAPDRPRAWPALKADLRRYLEPGWPLARKLRTLFEFEGPLLCATLRVGTWIYFESPRWAATPLKLFYKPVQALIATVFDTHIDPACNIGPGFFFGHHGGIWVTPLAVIGANCNISPGVVIGAAGAEPRGPVIGDRVWLGPHAVITGPIRVGDEAVIGANSLVTGDVPAKAVVIGVPARVVTFSGSAKLVRVPVDGPPTTATPGVAEPKPAEPAAAKAPEPKPAEPAAAKAPEPKPAEPPAVELKTVEPIAVELKTVALKGTGGAHRIA